MDIWKRIWRSLLRDYHDPTIPQAERQYTRFAMRGAARRHINTTAKTKVPPTTRRKG